MKANNIPHTIYKFLKFQTFCNQLKIKKRSLVFSSSSKKRMHKVDIATSALIGFLRIICILKKND